MKYKHQALPSSSYHHHIQHSQTITNNANDNDKDKDKSNEGINHMDDSADAKPNSMDDMNNILSQLTDGESLSQMLSQVIYKQSTFRDERSLSSINEITYPNDKPPVKRSPILGDLGVSANFFNIVMSMIWNKT